MTLSPKQRAKRRWKAQRDVRAALQRSIRNEYRATTVRFVTPYGTLHCKGHPLYMGGTKLPPPGRYETPVFDHVMIGGSHCQP